MEERKLKTLTLKDLVELKDQVKLQIITSNNWLHTRDLQKYLDKINKAIDRKINKIWDTN